MRMILKITVIILFALFAGAEEHECHPRIPYFKGAKFWTNKYTLRKSGVGWIVTNFHRSRQIIDAEPGPVEAEFRNDKVHAYTQLLSLHQVGRNVPIRRTFYTQIFTFYQGDNCVIHTFNPFTKIYNRVELGLHSLHFVAVVESGVWLAIDFEKHVEEKQALLGVSEIRGLTNDTSIQFADRQQLLKDFPEQSEIIMRLTLP